MPSLVRISPAWAPKAGSRKSASVSAGKSALSNKRANVVGTVQSQGSGTIKASLPQAVDKDSMPSKAAEKVIGNEDDDEEKEKENTNPSNSIVKSDSTINTSGSTNGGNDAEEIKPLPGKALPDDQPTTINVVDHASVQAKSTPTRDHQPTLNVRNVLNDHAKNSIDSIIDLSNIESSPETVTSVNNSSTSNDEDINPYIALREARIARNQKRLSDLGLLNPPPPPKTKQQTISKKPQPPCLEPLRRSSRKSALKPPQDDNEMESLQNSGKRIHDALEVTPSDPLSDPEKKRSKSSAKETPLSTKVKCPSLSTTAKPSKERAPKPKPLYSFHRFLISDEGMLGIDTGAFHEDQRCIVMRNVPPNSLAFRHGVELNDEIILPKSTTSEQGTTAPKVYDLFHKAANHRPLLFEVKREYKSTTAVVPESLELVGRHSLHRFVINEAGFLGIGLRRDDCTATTVITSIQPNSLGDMYGLRENDVICEPFESVWARSSERPWILQVWRSVSTNESEKRRPVLASSTVENPFIFSFPSKLSMDTTEEKVAEDEVIACNAGEEVDAIEKDKTGQEDEPSAAERGNVGAEIIVIDDEDD